MLGKPGQNRWSLEAVEKEHFLKIIVSYLSYLFVMRISFQQQEKLDRKAGSGIVKGSKSFLLLATRPTHCVTSMP